MLKDSKTPIDELNEKHAVVINNGKCLILNEEPDPVTGQKRITYSNESDFKLRYKNREVQTDKGLAPVANLWLSSPDRKQYNGIDFYPHITDREVSGNYNLYQGFAVQPIPGDWSLMQAHIHDVLAAGNEDIATWLRKWMATKVQFPGGDRIGVCPVFKGGQGAGKSMPLSLFGEIFGVHFVQLSDPQHLIGRFNSHLQGALFVLVDEGAWRDDKRSEGKLKALVTEPYVMIEAKYQNVFRCRNYADFVFTSNNDRIVPAGIDERRFCVIDVSDNRIGEREYFNRLVQQMNDGGKAAMLHDLLHEDLKGFDVRKFPRTKALFEQMYLSADSVGRFILDKLREGDWTRKESKPDFHKAYTEYCKEIGWRGNTSAAQFGRELHKWIPSIGETRPNVDSNRVRYYLFPDLAECRAFIEKKTGCAVKWDDVHAVLDDVAEQVA